MTARTLDVLKEIVARSALDTGTMTLRREQEADVWVLDRVGAIEATLVFAEKDVNRYRITVDRSKCIEMMADNGS
jgi:hypothetical protein